ncbi:hypothetical protein BA190_10285 [Labrys sp. WJW]|uniref:hypothetical protein n=1 Tax=Labrys sp. WJW TaxID=1737983 RepID=UPI000833F12F|nr:hypothetical protein [Labrys sp. WJW]OCC05282.1 hypothetical protein BA190_10285 [Labrys sp. WJW]
MIATAVAFLTTSKLGRALGVAALVLLALGGVYLAGRHDQARKAEIAALEAKLAIKTADLQISMALADIAQDEIRASEQAAAANQDKIDDYEKALAERPDTRCALGADDVRRLRALNPAP